MKFLFCGDLFFNIPVKEDLIAPQIFELFKRVDYSFLNLESPVTQSSIPIIKTGPNLRMSPDIAKSFFSVLKPDVVTLANNHILDFGAKGIKDTLGFLQQNKIKSVGAGMDLEEAKKPFFMKTSVGKIAIINFAENEWASATKDSAGAHPMNVVDNAYLIRETRLKADFVFVIIHGGHEYYNLPSPRMKKQYRFYVDCGADLIVAHHPHCISGHEVYKDVPIFYSLGNFLFTKFSKNKEWYKGLILEVELKDKKLTTELHPIQQLKNSFNLKLLLNEEKEVELTRVENFRNIIEDDELLIKYWKEYAASKKQNILNSWSPLAFISNRYIRAGMKRLGLGKLNVSGKKLFLNLMRCEAHRDLSQQVLHSFIKDENSHP